MADVATLGLQIDASGALQVVDNVGQKLDALASKGEGAAQRVQAALSAAGASNASTAEGATAAAKAMDGVGRAAQGAGQAVQEQMLKQVAAAQAQQRALTDLLRVLEAKRALDAAAATQATAQVGAQATAIQQTAKLVGDTAQLVATTQQASAATAALAQTQTAAAEAMGVLAAATGQVEGDTLALVEQQRVWAAEASSSYQAATQATLQHASAQTEAATATARTVAETTALAATLRQSGTAVSAYEEALLRLKGAGSLTGANLAKELEAALGAQLRADNGEVRAAVTAGLLSKEGAREAARLNAEVYNTQLQQLISAIGGSRYGSSQLGQETTAALAANFKRVDDAATQQATRVGGLLDAEGAAFTTFGRRGAQALIGVSLAAEQFANGSEGGVRRAIRAVDSFLLFLGPEGLLAAGFISAGFALFDFFEKAERKSDEATQKFLTNINKLATAGKGLDLQSQVDQIDQSISTTRLAIDYTTGRLRELGRYTSIDPSGSHTGASDSELQAADLQRQLNTYRAQLTQYEEQKAQIRRSIEAAQYRRNASPITSEQVSEDLSNFSAQTALGKIQDNAKAVAAARQVLEGDVAKLNDSIAKTGGTSAVASREAVRALAEVYSALKPPKDTSHAVQIQMDEAARSYRKVVDASNELLASVAGADRPYQAFLNRLQSIDNEIADITTKYRELKTHTAAQTAEYLGQISVLGTLRTKVSEAGEAFRQQRMNDLSLDIRKTAAGGVPTDMVNVDVAADEARKHVRQLTDEMVSLNQNLAPSQMQDLVDMLAVWGNRVVQNARQTATANVELSRTHELIDQISTSRDLHTDNPATQLVEVNQRYGEAVARQKQLVAGSQAWRVAQEEINALLRERKTLEIDTATKPLAGIVNQGLLDQLRTEIADAGTGTTKQQRDQLDAAMKQLREQAIVEATKETQETVSSNRPLEEKIAILERIRQSLQTIGAIKPDSDSILGVLAGGLHQLGDLANVFHDSGLGNVLNTAGNAVGNVQGAYKTAQANGGGLSGFMSLASIQPDIAAITSVVAIASELFGTSEVMQDWKQIMQRNNEAIAQLTLKMEGFIPGSVDNMQAAANALRGYLSDPNAQQQLQANVTQTGSFWGGHFSNHSGGDLQSQINALAPYLNQAFGPTTTTDQLDKEWQKLVEISKTVGVTLTDQWGRIVPDQVAKLVQALDAATQATFTLTKSFSDQQSLFTLINEASGKRDTRAQYQAALQAFGVAAPNALAAAGIADPTTAAGMATDNSLAAENKVRQFIQSVLAQEQAAVASGKAFDPSKFGSFTSIPELNSALSTLISPLNELTNTVNGVIDSLTHVPAGFRVALDRFNASTPGNPHSTGITGIQPGQIPVPTPPLWLPASNPFSPPLTPGIDRVGTLLPPAPVLTRVTAPLPAPTDTASEPTTDQPIQITGPVNITVAGPNADALLDQLVDKLQKLAKRGGTSRLNIALGRY